MTGLIIFVAMLVSVHVSMHRGIDQAFLCVWIPVFLSMPTAFKLIIPGLPVHTFMEAASIPILLILLKTRQSALQFGRMESMLAIYIVIRVFCDFLSRGYPDARNYSIYLMYSVVGPYLLGRYLIRSRRMDIDTARMFVLMFLLFFPLFLYEARFWVSPVFRLLSGFFPDASSGLSIRWGLARTAGTFEHPILACIMIVAVYRLHRWLCWMGEWDRPQTSWTGILQRQARRLPMAFKNQISLVLILMALMTISRGPWIGALAGAILTAAGNTRQRRKALMFVIAFFIVAGVAGQLLLTAYITPRAGEILSGEAQTMLYRKEMVDQYKAFLMDRMWTGWGLTTVPKIHGMESVDNAFFLMALQHGLLAPAMFLLILFYAITTQIRFGLRTPPGTPPIGFTFSGIYLACLIAFSTVYMGAQTEPMIFLLLGWGESIKNRTQEQLAGISEHDQPALPPLPFRRILS